jgi:hypothetical protein
VKLTAVGVEPVHSLSVLIQALPMNQFTRCSCIEETNVGFSTASNPPGLQLQKVLRHLGLEP